MSLLGRSGRFVVGVLSVVGVVAGSLVSLPVSRAQVAPVPGKVPDSPVPPFLRDSVVRGDASRASVPLGSGGANSLGVADRFVSGELDSRPFVIDRRGRVGDTDLRSPWLAELTGPDGSLAVKEDSDANRGAGNAKGKTKIGERVVDRSTAKIPASRSALRGVGGVADSGVRQFTDEELSVELPELRTASSKTYRNPDGTLTARLYDRPVHAKDSKALFVDVDPSLTSDGVVVRGDGGNFRSVFAVVASPGAALVSFLFDDPVSGGGQRKVSFSMVGSSGARAVVDGSKVSWPSIVPGADFVAVQRAGSVKSSVVVRDRVAGSQFRFEYSAPKGWLFRGSASLKGALELVDDKGAVVGEVEPATASDASGVQGRAAWVVDSAGKVPALVLTVDAKWLLSAKLPVEVDPTLNVGLAPSTMTDAMVWAKYPNAPYAQGVPWDQPNYLRNIVLGSWEGEVSRGLFRHELPLLLIDRPVVSARWKPFFENTNGSAGQLLKVAPVLDPWSQWTVTWNTQPALDPSLEVTSPVVSGWGDIDMLEYVRRWQTDPAHVNYGFMVKAVNALGEERSDGSVVAGARESETNGYGISYLEVVYEDTATLPAAAQYLWPVSTVSPSAKSLRLNTTTPTFIVTPAGPTTQYWYRVATSPQIDSVVYNSGWLTSTTHTIPAGFLKDGRAYWWQVFTRLPGQGGWRQSSPCSSTSCQNRFGVNLNLAPNSEPSDSLAGAAVNLVSGNLTHVNTPAGVSAVGGSSGFSFTYNSQQPSVFGVTGRYKNLATGEVELVRDDSLPQVLGGASPGGSLPAVGWTVEWNGKIRVPTTGTYAFGATGVDRYFAYINGAQVADSWAGVYLGVPLVAGQLYDFRATAGRTWLASTDIKLTVSGPGVSALSPTWFVPTTQVMPNGWTMSGAGGAAYSGMVIDGAVVTVYDAAGSGHVFRATDDTQLTFASPPGEENLVLGRDSNGTYTLLADSTTIIFNSNGAIQQVKTAQDLTQGLSLSYVYAGNPSRLAQVVDPVSNQVVQLQYWGNLVSGPSCPSTTAIESSPQPVGALCAINWWDGRVTRVLYYPTPTGDFMGRVHTIDTYHPSTDADPHKRELWQYSYDASGRIEKVWDPYVSELMQYGLVSAADGAAQYSYDGSGRVAWMQTSSRTATQPGIRHTVGYASTQAAVTVGSPTTGLLTSWVTWDSEFRVTQTIDAAGKVSTVTWAPPSSSHAKDLVLSTTSAGRVTQNHYDNAGRLLESYGPCPAALYGVDRRPVAGAKCPGSTSVYDGGNNPGVGGLLGVYWNDTAGRHNVGAPVAVGTIPHLGVTWTGGQPIAGLGAQNWSARFTGYVRLDVAGEWRFRLGQSDGVRLWIDDRLVVNSWADITQGTSESGKFGVAVGETGWHRVRVDMYEKVGPSSLFVYGKPPAGVESIVSAAMLSPGYDRVTSQTVLDDSGAPSITTVTDYGPKPWLGLLASVTVDPGGLNLTTSYVYDAANWNRVVSKTMPGGNTWLYSYWGTNSAGSCGSANGVSQMGRLHYRQHPGSSGPLIEEFEYSRAGVPVVGRQWRSGGQTTESCSTVDARQRVTQTVSKNVSTGVTEKTLDFFYQYGDNGSYSYQYEYGLGGGFLRTNEWSQRDWLGGVTTNCDSFWQCTQTALDAINRPYWVRSVAGNAGSWVTDLTYGTGSEAGYLKTVTTGLDVGAATTLNYQADGDLASVAYSGGDFVLTVGYDSGDRQSKLEWRKGAVLIASDEVVRSRSGRVVDQLIDGVDQSLAVAGFTYDGAGRLIGARPATGNVLSYSFGTPSCGWAGSGKNGNRTTKTVNGVVTGFCFDDADRLTSVTGAGATAVTYDDHNRVSTLSGKTFGWNARNEHVSTTAGAVTVGIERDGYGRVFRRSHTGQNDVWYGYGTGDDKASYTGTVTAGALTLTDQMQSLPGGVTLSRKPAGGQTRYTVPNVHGDMLAVVDQTGVKQGATYKWDPDGMPTGGTTQPDLLSGGFENGWLAQHFRPVDTTDPAIPVIEMGARPYLPSIGRFLSVDPVEGGNANDYNYPTDPVNQNDLTGMYVAGACLAAEFVFVFGFEASLCYFMDDDGNSDFYLGVGFGVGVGVDYSYQFIESNADTIDDMTGWSASAAASVGPFGVTGSAWAAPGGGNYVSGGVSFGGGPLPASATAAAVRTWELDGWKERIVRAMFGGSKALRAGAQNFFNMQCSTGCRS